MEKEVIKEIALQAGGSHYPEVGGKTLEKFAELLIEACIEAVEKTGKQCALTTYDLNVIECTIAKSVQSIKDKFEIK